ncbi:biopolymer transporter ExbD [candidate division KSB1 bacterium]|nr:biopolymer transporter ExbD [candidate division KSB1 bacterium]
MFVDKGKKEGVEIPTSSLADIAFLLLIFFLVTTTIDTDKGISLALPEKGETKEINKKNIANLLINANGDIMLDEQPISVREIENRARDMIRQNDLIIFSVKTDAKTQYDIYIDVLDQLKRANAKRISIAEPES